MSSKLNSGKSYIVESNGVRSQLYIVKITETSINYMGSHGRDFWVSKDEFNKLFSIIEEIADPPGGKKMILLD